MCLSALLSGNDRCSLQYFFSQPYVAAQFGGLVRGFKGYPAGEQPPGSLFMNLDLSPRVLRFACIQLPAGAFTNDRPYATCFAGNVYRNRGSLRFINSLEGMRKRMDESRQNWREEISTGAAGFLYCIADVLLVMPAFGELTSYI